MHVRLDVSKKLQHRYMANSVRAPNVTVLDRLVRFKPLKGKPANRRRKDSRSEDRNMRRESSSLDRRSRVKTGVNAPLVQIEHDDEDDSDDDEDLELESDDEADGESDDDYDNSDSDDDSSNGEDMLDGEDEPDPRQYLGKALLSAGRVRYRHAELPPRWFVDKQEEICSYRTKAQIRRCLKDWMIQYDRELQRKYRNKRLLWGETLPTKQADGNAPHSNSGGGGGGGGSGGKSPGVKYGPEESVAYAFYYMPARFALLDRVFSEVRALMGPGFKPGRTLDFGCGPGTAAAALHQVWGAAARQYVGVDVSQSMVDAAKIMTHDLVPQCTFHTSTMSLARSITAAARQKPVAVRQQQPPTVADPSRFDLAIASFTLSELDSDPARRVAVQLLFETLDVGGLLVIVEAGNPQGSHTCRTARQFVLDTFSHVGADGVARPPYPSTHYPKLHHQALAQDDRVDQLSRSGQNRSSKRERGGGGRGGEGGGGENIEISMMLPAPAGFTHDQLRASVIAPCTHDKPCPLAPGAWCSFAQKVRASYPKSVPFDSECTHAKKRPCPSFYLSDA